MTLADSLLSVIAVMQVASMSLQLWDRMMAWRKRNGAYRKT